jgi:hypothetical protein
MGKPLLSLIAFALLAERNPRESLTASGRLLFPKILWIFGVAAFRRTGKPLLSEKISWIFPDFPAARCARR